MLPPYSGSMRPNPLVTPEHLPMKRKKGWRKTVVVVSLKKRDGKGSSTKGNSKVEYEIVTQITVSLDSSSPCTVRKVTDLVSKQIRMDVILLDSKCYPLLENDSTSVESFWRGTRKVLAANRAMYDKLTGRCTSLQNASVDLTGEDSHSSVGMSPAQKRPCRDAVPSSIEEKLDKIVRGVSSIERLMTLLGNLQMYIKPFSVWCVVVLSQYQLLPGAVAVLLAVNAAWMVGLSTTQHALIAHPSFLSTLWSGGLTKLQTASTSPLSYIPPTVTSGLENVPPHGQTAILPFFTIQMGELGSRSNISAMVPTCKLKTE